MTGETLHTGRENCPTCGGDCRLTGGHPVTGDQIETAEDGRDYSNVIGRASSETPEPGSLDHLAYPDGPSRVRPAPVTDMRADIEALGFAGIVAKVDAEEGWENIFPREARQIDEAIRSALRAILAAHPTVESAGAETVVEWGVKYGDGEMDIESSRTAAEACIAEIRQGIRGGDMEAKDYEPMTLVTRRVTMPTFTPWTEASDDAL